jgi:hypothetical protein
MLFKFSSKCCKRSDGQTDSHIWQYCGADISIFANILYLDLQSVDFVCG